MMAAVCITAFLMLVWTGWSFGIFLTNRTTTGLVRTRYTLILNKLPWNAAYQICREREEMLVNLNSSIKMTEVKSLLQNSWRHLEGKLLDKDGDRFWGGISRPDLSEPLNDSYKDPYCRNLQWTHWNHNVLHVDTDRCISHNAKNVYWYISKCDQNYPFVCEKSLGPCIFNCTQGVIMGYHSDEIINMQLSVEKATCQKKCLYKQNANGKHCWGYAFSGTQCTFYFSDHELEVREEETQPTVCVRICREGHFMNVESKITTAGTAPLVCQRSSISVIFTIGKSTNEMARSITKEIPSTTANDRKDIPSTTTANGKDIPSTTTANDGKDIPSTTAANDGKDIPSTFQAVESNTTIDCNSSVYYSCECKTTQEVLTNKTIEEILKELAPVLEELKIPKKLISAYKRKFISAKDDRPSAKSIGGIGVMILILVFSSIILMDSPRLLKDLRNIRKKVIKLCRQREVV